MSSEAHPRRGLMLALVSPSGAGKTTLSRRLVEEDADIALSVSWTTRAPRPGEEDGVHYHFVDKDQFRAHRAQDGFLEWAEVHDHYYGSPRESAFATLQSGRDLMFDVDWQGALQLRTSAPEDVVKVFILPPSMAELKRRLISRGQDTAEVIKKRMTNAYGEISRWENFDYVLVNADIEDSYHCLKTILAAERMRRARQPWMGAFVQGLLREDT
ncbi:guanylate kinase [Candidatus Phycosocius bacilliformis]|uniref:Guanylate kinase n=1 Tax=Candidatus Phycosocius bacilliformis TaxID=1445552 RepID=A0A2P2E8B6_9PROT|nr:guanylate kinase [Candidatus Phycosocius bacilliformis]GBF57316.1 guanylate kinase [Candidatus Phycosocius bacilliformis]